MKKNYILKCFLLALFGFGISGVWSQVTTYSYTGSSDTYTVPPGVYSISIECWGAEGETGLGAAGGAGGLGGYAIGTAAVTPGEILTVYVGGKNGYNGGAPGGDIGAANGGGASDVRAEGVALADRIIVGGGGGGGGATGCALDWAGGVGGDGGGGSGTAGADSPNGGGGFPGTLGAGGAAGIGCGGYLGSPGLATGEGGNGQGCCCVTTPGGGGGGGGYEVGGGGGGGSAGTTGCSGNDKGGGGGGAGGSSFTGTLTDASTTDGIRSGDGEIIITVLCDPLTVTVTDDAFCLGESVTLDAEGAGTITWDGGVIDEEPFTPMTAGTHTFTATSDDDGDCEFIVNILVYALPEVVATVDTNEICYGETVTLTGEGAFVYEWFPIDVADGVPYTPEAGVTTFTVVGYADITGCENTDEIVVTVHELPEVIAEASDEAICLGEEITLTGVGATEYVWDPETVEDGVPFSPGATGTFTYSVEGLDDNGCYNDASVDIEVYSPLELTYETTEEIWGSDATINLTVTGGNPAYSFDWDNDGTGDFDDTEDIGGIVGGTYVVVVQCSAGCTISETIEIASQVSIDELNGLSLDIYPNPTTDNITIAIEGAFTYVLTAVNGEVIYTGAGVNQEMINMENLANGVYFVKVNSNDKTALVKVVKE